jgi:hypothetical protein
VRSFRAPGMVVDGSDTEQALLAEAASGEEAPGHRLRQIDTGLLAGHNFLAASVVLNVATPIGEMGRNGGMMIDRRMFVAGAALAAVAPAIDWLPAQLPADGPGVVLGEPIGGN